MKCIIKYNTENMLNNNYNRNRRDVNVKSDEEYHFLKLLSNVPVVQDYDISNTRKATFPLFHGQYLLFRTTVHSLFPSFSLPNVLCDPTNLIWRKGTPFEAMTGCTVPSSDGLLAQVFWGFPRL